MLDKSQLNHLPNTYATEIDKFDALAQQWWDPNGKYKRVLDFNQCRWQVIEKQLQQHFGEGIDAGGLTAVDIGSGGGLLCEPLAKMGFAVTGVDASEMSVKVAQRHAAQNNLSINYRHCLSSDLMAEGERYDLVMNTEVIEHVPDQQQLMDECCQLLKPGGLLVLATLNRTIKSFIFGIVGAEYVLRLLPVGTHDWRAFVKPKEMAAMLAKNNCQPFETIGVAFNPFTGNWSETSNASVNYLLFAKTF
jgi:2-polyprenyl-6-hydroxyphenyl methylase/3-demethylubiquinone-9 3-methyltransferase